MLTCATRLTNSRRYGDEALSWNEAPSYLIRDIIAFRSSAVPRHERRAG
jgi:hypothetical protein